MTEKRYEPLALKGSTEVRITSATGGQKGQKEARLGGSDPLAMMELSKVYGMGEEKYDRYNYLKGYPWSLSVDALYRHLLAFLSGEDRDPESGLLHTAHVAWHALTLTSFQLRDVGTDDRAPEFYPDEPTCCDYACYEDPGCQCGGCIATGLPSSELCACHFPGIPMGEAHQQEMIRRGATSPMDVGPSCDHGVLFNRTCYACREDWSRL